MADRLRPMSRLTRRLRDLLPASRAHTDRRSRGDRAIVTLSVGARPFFADVLPSMQRYADRVGAHLEVMQFPELTATHRELLATAPALPPTSSAQLLKLFCVRMMLERFDRVLLLDDSCYVSKHCPDIFAAGDGERLGAVEDGGALGNDGTDGRGHATINTGVLLFEQRQRQFLARLELLLHSCRQWVPDQILVNEAIASGDLEPKYLDWRFNVVGSQLARLDELAEAPWIYHITSGLAPERRSELAAQLRARDA